jgi:cyclopropane fatty-acyl-phospholipid synthase-like methyltransferase
MFNSDTDKVWEDLGKNDPYFGVLTFDKYRKENFSESDKEEFIQSGYEHINVVFEKVRLHIDKDFKLNEALDFGCGVGRLVIPLSNFAQHVDGIDVSDSMLTEARRNCLERNIQNVDFLLADDELKNINKKYSFIHSFIVFQHIPTSRGKMIFKHLLNSLEDGGIGVVHFTYGNNRTQLRKLVPLVKAYIPFAANLISLLKGDGLSSAQMQMNNYNLNEILFELQHNGITNSFIEFTNHRNHFGVILYFQKSFSSSDVEDRLGLRTVT